MKFGILGPNEKYYAYTTKRLIEEAKKEFKKVSLIPLIDVKLKIENGIDAVYGKESLKKFDYILPRIDSKRASIGYPVIKFLDTMGVKKPYSSELVLTAHNKFLTLQVLAENGIAVPKTYLTASKESAKEIIQKEKLPIILKLLSGFGGQGVMFMESREAAESAIETMKTLKQEILLEEYIKSSNEDIRGIVVGGEIIASYKRVAAEGEKKANIKSGGRTQLFKLTGEMEEIVIKCAEALKCDILAVDMLNSGNKILVIEVNINFGLQGIEKATDKNVAHSIISYIKSEIKR